MSPLEIVLIILGIITIMISCVMVDKSQRTDHRLYGQKLSVSELLNEEEMNKIKVKIDELLLEISEESILHTDDSLSRISNEKIIAINEFSDQILEKIKRNHEEVIFLYNMLNDKESELKNAVKEIDASKRKVQEIIDTKKVVEQDKTENRQMTVKQVQKSTSPNPEQKTTEPIAEKTTLNSINTNNNTQILSLFSQGKSVVEISKLLNLGQGEVKLVIDLFKGK